MNITNRMGVSHLRTPSLPLDPARFVPYLEVHLLSRYTDPTDSAAFMTVEQLCWARIEAAVSGTSEVAAGHEHAFWRD